MIRYKADRKRLNSQTKFFFVITTVCLQVNVVVYALNGRVKSSSTP